MKTKILLSVVATVLMLNTSAQKSVIELTFTTTYYNQYVPLDSVLVENLTKGCDTLLYFPDTVLVLDISTGIDMQVKGQEEGFIIFPNSPNPFREKTAIRVYLPEKLNIRFAVINETGQELNSITLVLDKGLHSFTFIGGNEHFYIFTASGLETVKATRMLAFPDQYSTNSHLVYEGPVSYSSIHTKGRLINGFTFSPGDSLRYTGFAQTPSGVAGSDVSSDSPIQSQTYQFEIVEGIPCPGIPSLTYEGQTYKTVQIGTQCWFKENLNAGTMIDGSLNQTNNGILEKYCYDNLTSYCNIFGGYYQWDEMMQYSSTSGVQGICPAGWHIPSNADWCIVTQYIDSTVDCNAIMQSGTDVGFKMKATTNWCSSGNGTNVNGFTAFGGGYMYNGTFINLAYDTQLWSSSQYDYDASKAWDRGLGCGNGYVFRNIFIKTNGVSVRCLHD